MASVNNRDRGSVFFIGELTSPYVRGRTRRRKEPKRLNLLFCLLLSLLAFSPYFSSPCHAEEARKEIRILLDQPPISLHPRRATDGTGQRFITLLYRGLTRLDTELGVQADLASSWQASSDAKAWTFRIATNLTDQDGSPLTAQKIAECLENYRNSKPSSPLLMSLPNLSNWEGTYTRGNDVTLRLNSPDVYLPRTISALKYFRAPSTTSPCAENGDASPHTFWGNGAYEMISPERLRARASDAPDLVFQFVEDHITRTLKLLRGEADLAFNSLPPAKAQWLQKKNADQFQFIERDGVGVSYLAFNFRHPFLKIPAVRKAIALAIDREAIVKTPLHQNLTPAGSLLSPLLEESYQSTYKVDTTEANRLLEAAGFPIQKATGFRFNLHFKTTPMREGMDTALILREMLKKIRINLLIEVSEAAVYFSSLRKGHFDLFVSRWLNVADGSILYRTLHSKSPSNRGAYSDPQMDQWLEQALRTTGLEPRKTLLKNIQIKMAEDLPYLPLWTWKNLLILRKTPQKSWSGISEKDISLSGAFTTFGALREHP